MLEITSFSAGSREAFDVHAVRLPDGIRAWDLEQDQLYRRMAAAGVPDINPNIGKQELVVRLGRWLAANRRDPVTNKLPNEA